MNKSKVQSVDDAISLIKDGDTVTTGGFIGAGFAEEIAINIEKKFLKNQTPKNLTLVYCAGQGDFDSKGLSHFGHEGLITMIIGGHFGASPKLSDLIIQNKIQAYNFPQGVISQMFRDIAAKKPRTITTVGLHTFVDPRIEGGKINSITTEDMVEIIEFDGNEYLAYKTFPIDVAILRGTTADEDGNITMEKEALTLEVQAQAMAAKKVIVQVERVVKRGTLNPKLVKIPGILVDAIIVCKDKKNHKQTFGTTYNPSFSGEIKVSMASISPNFELNARKIIARRAADELESGDVVNLGIGMPEGIASVANELGMLDDLTLTAEPGIIGGIPANELNFGAAFNPEAIIDQPSQFDLYHSGRLDKAFLSFVQVDGSGVNVSKFNNRLTGAGGFIDISQSAKKLIFVGTFTAKGLKVKIENKMLHIVKEGNIKKFIRDVEQITFNCDYAIKRSQQVLFITERCVFKLTKRGLELIEFAPGIDIDKHILRQMEFCPIFSEKLKPMESKNFG